MLLVAPTATEHQVICRNWHKNRILEVHGKPHQSSSDNTPGDSHTRNRHKNFLVLGYFRDPRQSNCLRGQQFRDALPRATVAKRI